VEGEGKRYKSGPPAVRNVAVRPTLQRLSELIPVWLDALDASPKTKAGYRSAIRRFVPLLCEKDANITEADIIHWRDSLVESGLKPATVNQYLSAISNFFAWLQRKQVYPDITRGIRRFRADGSPLRGVLAPEDAARVLQEMHADGTLRGKRDFAMFNLIIRTGLRTIEAVRAVCGDMKEMEDRMVLWVQGKGRDAKDRFVVLSPKVLQPLHEYLAERPGGYAPERDAERPLFERVTAPGRPLSTRTVRYAWSAYAKRCGLSHVTPHWLRHSFATYALRSGADVVRLKESLRHAKLESTMRYLHVRRLDNAPEDLLDEYDFALPITPKSGNAT